MGPRSVCFWVHHVMWSEEPYMQVPSQSFHFLLSLATATATAIAAAAMLPPEAERILSRYRPIAPKVAPPSTSSNGHTSTHPSSSSGDTFASSASSSGKRRRRPLLTRKTMATSDTSCTKNGSSLTRIHSNEKVLPFSSTPTYRSGAGTLPQDNCVTVIPADGRIIQLRQDSVSGGCFAQMIRGIKGHSLNDVAAVSVDYKTDLDNSPCTGSSKQVESEVNQKDDLRDRNQHVTLSLLPVDACVASVMPAQLCPPVMDPTSIQQVYGSSSEPVLLVDDSSQQILWLNSAYSKATRAASERRRACEGAFPYIDPIGVPTPLGTFALLNRKATLWGFLKKLVFHEPDITLALPSGHSPATNYNIMKSINPSVVVGGGSVVSLESITEVQMQTSGLDKRENLTKAELESESRPVMISDGHDQVQWVNTAYKEMVGPGQIGLSPSHSECKNTESSEHVSLLCGKDIAIPRTAAAFSGRVNIRWAKNRSTRSISSLTTPCDVVRIGSDAGTLLWKFDVATSLSLSTGT